jgi:uncharacterized coiled-coil DUF342 family protein
VASPAPSLEHDLDRALIETLELQDAVAARDAALDACAARIAKLLARRDALLATVARISQETPLPDEVRNALEQRGALLAEVGTLRAEVTAVRREASMLIEGLHDVTADRDHWRRTAETEIDGRSADLEEIARLTEERDAWQRAAERMRAVYDAAGEAWDAGATQEGRAMCKLYQAVLDARRQALSEAVAKEGV